jgi:hypothetical protein
MRDPLRNRDHGFYRRRGGRELSSALSGSAGAIVSRTRRLRTRNWIVPSCHKVPTSNWLPARGFPDVAQFPGHVACASCHRQDFFVGNAAFCAGCHTKRESAECTVVSVSRASRSHEFATIFPHSVHQDVIALPAAR